MQDNKPLESKVRKYIKMKKFFVFSDALLITSASKDSLLRVLGKLESEELIKLDKAERSIMNRSYTVLSRREKKQLSLVQKKKPYDGELIKSISKILKHVEDEEVAYMKLLLDTKLSKGVFAKAVKYLVSLKVLTYKEEPTFYKQNRMFISNMNLINTLHTFLKQKDYEELQLILDGKKPLKYVQLPQALPEILETITQNEVLKRDELASLAGVTRKRLTDWWQVLKKLGVLKDSYKESQQARVTYIFNSKIAKNVLKSLNNGAYEKDKELKHLWMQ